VDRVFPGDSVSSDWSGPRLDGAAFRRIAPGYAQEKASAQPIARVHQLPGLWRYRMSEMIIESPDEVVAFLKAQHNLIEDMFDQVLHASDPHAREKPFVQLRQLLAVHETAEEMVVHPRVRREVDGSDSIVDARLEEEHEAKELLSRIEKIDITSQQFIDELTKLRDAVLDHAYHEEKFEFPKLERQLDADELKRLTSAVRAAEAIAPTRPHAGVESPLLNFAVGPFASMLDRARDLIQQAVG
jgi:hemerythrin superfamily protein